MRMRVIKPEFWRDQSVQGWGDRTQLLYIGLWCMADDCGRFQADLDSIRSEIAKRARAVDVEKAFGDLVSSGKVLTYEAQGEKFGVVTNWWHQKINRPSEPEWPCPPDEVCLKIIEKAMNHQRCRHDSAERLGVMFCDASVSVHAKIDEASVRTHRISGEDSVNLHHKSGDGSPLSRARALEQGSKGARERGGTPPVL